MSIPLHTVGFAYGDEPSVERLMSAFPDDLLIWPHRVYAALTEGRYRTSVDNIVLCEIEHQMVTALRLGRRVIIAASELDRRARSLLVDRAGQFGVRLYSFVCSDGETVQYRGTETYDARAASPDPIVPLPHGDASEYISERFDGITAVGDVHGNLEGFRAAVDWAQQRNHFIILAGDVVDYGPSSLEVADAVYQLVGSGQACLIAGNHERKIMRWSDGYRVRLSDGNRVTTLALLERSEAARQRWQGRFRGLYQHGRLVQQVGNIVFAHAAVHPAVWQDRPLDIAIENMAFFGEIDHDKSLPDRPVASFNWSDAVPAQSYAVVGHTIRSRTHPMLVTNDHEGHSLFLDTGSGKGGHLSSADFRIEQGRWRLKNFNIY